ncbi:neprilysin-2-like [Coccinella septempunctata]|uniref:neprilysin-2-like n=1 Tax=Coccinella septempunctata TaxID=41139 RepID=UPI001D065EC9|nr:neprilysin-2-like [Coccinella septempunctata]
MPDKHSSMKNRETWLGRRTTMEKILTAILILALLGFIIVAVVSYGKFSSNSKVSNICQTEGCVTTAANILRNMNPKVDPCEDFYEFACGRYIENNFIPEDEVEIVSFSEVGDRIDENYRNLLEKPIDENEIVPFQYTKKLYRMCMNYSKTEQEDFKLFKSMMKELGGWPVLEGNYWNEKAFDWKATQYNFRKLGFSHTQLISSYVGVDAKNSTKRIFTIGQPCSGFAKLLKKGMNETLVRAYYEYLVDIAILYGADKNQAVKDMKQYLEFRIELAKIMSLPEERRNASLEYNKMTIRELQVNYPSIPWLQYINTKLEPFVTLTYDDYVVVTEPEYIGKLEKLLAVTPKRAIANYLFVYIAEYRHFNDDMRKRALEFEKISYGVEADVPQWRKCVYGNSLHLAQSAMYVRHFMKGKSKNSVHELLKDIKSTFMENLKKNTWMDHKTKKRAIQKAEAMRSYVGYPDELLDDEEIEKYYEGLVIDEDSLLKTSLAKSIWYRNKYLRKYYEPYEKNDWKDKAFPTMVNAFYEQTDNSIVIPSGILHQPFFDYDRPQYLNYGSIGFVIGHEIIHGFDDQGRQYDKFGNLVDWWEPSSNKSFQEKADCMIQQYANYTNEKINMSLNGINTQGENIADNGGIKIAYAAYQKWLTRNKPELQLPGLKYTPQQLFWISAANVWCSKTRPEFEKLMIMNDYHSPNYYRIIIPFSNSGNFARDFSCPLGSRMNPKYKCRLW